MFVAGPVPVAVQVAGAIPIRLAASAGRWEAPLEILTLALANATQTRWSRMGINFLGIEVADPANGETLFATTNRPKVS